MDLPEGLGGYMQFSLVENDEVCLRESAKPLAEAYVDVGKKLNGGNKNEKTISNFGCFGCCANGFCC